VTTGRPSGQKDPRETDKFLEKHKKINKDLDSRSRSRYELRILLELLLPSFLRSLSSRHLQAQQSQSNFRLALGM
jgi:hypothetical protein